MLLTKVDLLPVLDDFSPEKAERNLRNLASAVPLFTVTVKSASAIEDWLNWLRAEVKAQQARVAKGETSQPAIQPEGAALHAS